MNERRNYMNMICMILMFLARLCLAAVFIAAGLNKFINFDQIVAFMSSKGLTPPVPLLFIAAFVEIIGGLSLVFGYKARWGAFILMLYLIPTTYIFHNFWTLTGEAQMQQLTEFLKNLAIFGGLLYVVCCGCSCRIKTKEPEKV